MIQGEPCKRKSHEKSQRRGRFEQIRGNSNECHAQRIAGEVRTNGAYDRQKMIRGRRFALRSEPPVHRVGLGSLSP
jgi:hypothetical protein